MKTFRILKWSRKVSGKKSLWNRIFSHLKSTNLIFRIFKEFLQINKKNKNEQFQNGQRIWIDNLWKFTTGQEALETSFITSLTLLVITEMQIKITVSYYLSQITSVRGDVEKVESSKHCWWEYKIVRKHLWKTLAGSEMIQYKVIIWLRILFLSIYLVNRMKTHSYKTYTYLWHLLFFEIRVWLYCPGSSQTHSFK